MRRYLELTTWQLEESPSVEDMRKDMFISHEVLRTLFKLRPRSWCESCTAAYHQSAARSPTPWLLFYSV